MTPTTIRSCGEAALMLECADLAEAVTLAADLERLEPDAVDVVAAARTVLVTARDATGLPALRRRVETILATRRDAPAGGSGSGSGTASAPAGAGAGADGRVGVGAGPGAGAGADARERTVTIDVRYDGADLADVADSVGRSVEALVRLHTSITWRAAFGGFAPGFFYLVDARELGPAGDTAGGAAGDAAGGAAGPAAGPAVGPTVGDLAGEAAGPAVGSAVGAADEYLPAIPRLGSPRPRVPAGSVAVADRFCAVYPGASPGGWRLLGTTDAALWDLDRPEPALLAPGVNVRFREIG